ncbi:hypothetical protein PN462_19630 [Spirulina sp. CS-785/01]|uniref:hypothetical protein n=1 Tax=Spirulina sp. CS-785/01 TaxID=3021716 RepID=UPI00232D06B8|nr:hypothetical protein [Spirulina sp. CS-785/01]MDB9315336.1 hypothetical protein [Spirulina sp. CS-785/01]
MLRRIGLTVLWVGFLIYAFGFAPPDSPETWTLIQRLSTGDWEGINPLIIALFNIMGVLPTLYLGIVLVDGRGQKIPAFPFAMASFAVGAFALLPYLILRQPNPDFPGEPNRLLKLLDSRGFGLFLLLVAVILLAFGLTQGNWADFVQQWQTSRFIHVMSLDFCLLSVLFPTLLGDDLARRGIQRGRIFWGVTLLPLLGPLLYLSVRPPLTQSSTPSPSLEVS